MNTPAPDPTVETVIWEPRPGFPGERQLAGRKTVRQVCDEIRAITGDTPPGCGEYFGIAVGTDPGAEWPAGRTVVFPVTGGSEGHYIHAEVILDSGGLAGSGRQAQLLLLGKTFDGWDAAWTFAQRLARILCV